MEKKIPEKKVAMKESDVFYVYEKRINKCINEGCEGVVKYGLIIKVGVTEDESINCFECNKCHMKYTPYPNYNRLENKNLSVIYNAEEVAEWCERTRHKVETRNALKEKKTFARTDRRPSDHRKSFEHKRSFGNGQDRFGDGRPRREGGYQNRDGYQRREGGYQNRDGYQRREGGYQSRDGYQRREGGYQNRDGYQRREGGYQSRDGYQRREGNYQNRDGYQRREGGYQNRDGYQRREGGYQNRDSYHSRGGYQNRFSSNQGNTGKTFTVKKGNIIITGNQKNFAGKKPYGDRGRRTPEENEK